MNVLQSLKQPRLAFIAAAVATVLAGASGAQQQEPTRENANRPETQQQTQVARSDSGLQTLEQFLRTKPLRVSKVVGMELQTRTGDNLGEVKDIMPSTAPGRDMQLIVSIGGVGDDQKLIAVPFDAAHINADGDELYTNQTRDQVAASSPVTIGARTSDSAAADRSATPQYVADLVGADVIGSGGDQVGEVDDIVISTASADSIRAVLQIGGIAGVGEKRISLPLSQLAVEGAANDEPQLRVAMDQAALERMPEFEYDEQTSAL
jgi:sporulation protein YlmC with PRC-barrel domain